MSIRDRINFLRLKLALCIFPKDAGGRCANRSFWAFNAPKIEVTFTVRMKSLPDGYSWEEMLKMLDVFLGRKATTQEWSQLVKWKENGQ